MSASVLSIHISETKLSRGLRRLLGTQQTLAAFAEASSVRNL